MMYKVLVFVMLGVLFLSDATDYRQKLLSIQECKIPEDKRDNDVKVTLLYSTNKVNRKTTLIYGNLTVDRRFGPVYISLRAYQLKQDNSKDLTLKLEKATCTNFFIKQMLKFSRHNIDEKCFAGPGLVAALDGLDIQNFAGIMNRAVTSPGRYSYEFETSTSKGILNCIYVICQVTEIK